MLRDARYKVLQGFLCHDCRSIVEEELGVERTEAWLGRYKAFLFVGIAYFLTAVLAPLAILILNGASWSYPMSGMSWSLVAGISGAAGAFFVLMAFGAKGSPAAVMSIVFAGAPIVNAACALAIHPPGGGWSSIRWQFFLGIVLAAVGGCLVSLYKPPPSPTADRQHQATAVHSGPAVGSD